MSARNNGSGTPPRVWGWRAPDTRPAPNTGAGAQEPLSREDIERKFRGNVAYGGWSDARTDQFLKFAKTAFGGKLDLSQFRG